VCPPCLHKAWNELRALSCREEEQSGQLLVLLAHLHESQNILAYLQLGFGLPCPCKRVVQEAIPFSTLHQPSRGETGRGTAQLGLQAEQELSAQGERPTW
jgi:hypothetical protein